MADTIFVLGDLVDRGDGGVNGTVVGVYLTRVWVKVDGVDDPFTFDRSALALVKRSKDQWLRLHRDRAGNLSAGERTTDRANAVAYQGGATNQLVGLVHQLTDGTLVLETLVGS